jgi:hypothetical protein
MARISELGTKLAVTNNRRTLQRNTILFSSVTTVGEGGGKAQFGKRFHSLE